MPLCTLAPEGLVHVNSKSLPLTSPNRPDFPVVGIGASAGGLEAFTELLRHLPADTGMAFVLVQHLDPRHRSLLAELLSPKTPMAVVEATDGLLVSPNSVYVAPPAKDMRIEEGVLRLSSSTFLRPSSSHRLLPRLLGRGHEVQGGRRRSFRYGRRRDPWGAWR